MHISDEKIAELIDGKISKDDLELLLAHAAKCNECFELIAESIRTYKDYQVESLPQLSDEAVKKAEELVRFEEDKVKGRNLFRINKPLPAFAVLIFIVIIGAGTWYYFNVNQKNISTFRAGNSTIELRINNPSDEESLTKDNLVFSWQEIKNAVGYQLTIFDEYGNVIVEKRTKINHIDISNEVRLISGKKYSWQVDAFLPNASKINSKLNVFTLIEK